MTAHPKQAEAMIHIRQCIETHGIEHGVAVARVKFADVSQPSWSRWSRAVKAAIESEHATREGQQGVTLGTASPAAVSALDFFEQQLAAGLQDVELLRQQALVTLDGGATRVRNPVMLANATRLRSQLLNIYVARSADAATAARMESYRELITSAITHVLDDPRDPAQADLVRRLSEALRNADAQWREVSNIADPRRAAAVAEAGK